MATKEQQQKKTAILDDTVLAMWKVGFVQPIDIAVFLFMAGASFTFVVWCIAQHTMTLAAYIVYFSAMNIAGIAWTILLCFRACMFSLKTRANLESLPEQAAAVLYAYMKQGPEAGASGDK